MKNILSYKDTKFTGKEILEWAHYQVDNQTSHAKQGARILKYFHNIHLDRMYSICGHCYDYTCYTCYDGYTLRKHPIICRVK